jgi:hypothetical protein
MHQKIVLVKQLAQAEVCMSDNKPVTGLLQMI